MEICQFQWIFLLILLCFITTGEFCDGVECPASEKQALLDFKRVLHLNSTNKLFSWNGTNCCVWYGIGCDDTTGVVITVELFDIGLQNMNGHSIWPSLTTLKSLQVLHLGYNDFSDVLPVFIGNFHNLTELDLGSNHFHGLIPDSIRHLQSLSYLRLSSNKLNGSLPHGLGLLSQLSNLYLSNNQFSGVITESLFLNLTKLKDLSLEGNPVVVNLSSKWVPPFQLSWLDMSSCNIGTPFPAWIRSQKNIYQISLSNTNLSGSIPNWLWNISSLLDLDLSLNFLYGQLPNLTNSAFVYFDLSSNLLEGHLPRFNAHIANLVLSNNKLSSPIPTNMGDMMPNLNVLSLSNNNLIGEVPISIGNISFLSYLDLSGNNLTGIIPSTLGNLLSLVVLDLQRNNFFGEIPESLGMPNLKRLSLSNNKLSGKIPSSLKDLTKLKILDLANNNLFGNVPSWVGEVFPNLKILSLRSNSLSGELPLLYSNLTSLQILDLSENKFNGTIPASLSDLKAMAQLQHIDDGYGRVFSITDTYDLVEFGLNVHAMQLIYTKTLYLVTSIDLSGNSLYGEIPEEFSRLVGLVVLNLSRNHINGHIPQNISKLEQLLSLDLSSNNLSGSIPSVMSKMTFLQTLDLSNNNLSGRTPDGNQMSTFNKSSFIGNPGLCGEQINVTCGSKDSSRNGRRIDNGRKIQEEETDGRKSWYMSIGLGFFVGVVGPFLVFSVKRTWGGLYFAVVDLTVLKLSFGKYKAAGRIRRRS